MTRGLLGTRIKFAVLSVRRLLGDVRRNLHVTTVLSVRRSLFALNKVARPPKKYAFHHSLNVRRARSDERVVSRLSRPAEKKRIDFKEEQHFGRAAFLSAAFLSSFSQQPFSAAFLASLSSLSQPPSSAIISLWSGVGGHLLASSCCGQGLVVSY